MDLLETTLLTGMTMDHQVAAILLGTRDMVMIIQPRPLRVATIGGLHLLLGTTATILEALPRLVVTTTTTGREVPLPLDLTTALVSTLPTTVLRAILVAMDLLRLHLVTLMTVMTDVPLHQLIGTLPTLQGHLSDGRELLLLGLLGVVMTSTGPLSGMSAYF